MIKHIKTNFVGIENRRKYQYLLLLVITLVAAALRFYKLGSWSFWIDEIFTVGRVQAHYSSLEEIIQNVPPNWTWLPLSLLLTSGILNTLGTNEWSARLVPALIGIFSIPILYFPIRRLLGSAVALMAVLLLAVAPWHLYWSQNARYYTALLLFYSLALFAFFFALERDRLGYMLLFIVLTYLATSERLSALLIVPVVACYLLLLKILPFEKPPGLRARNLLPLILLPIVGVLFEIYRLVEGHQLMISDVYSNFLNGTIDVLHAVRLLSGVIYYIGVPLVCLAFFGGIYLLAAKKRLGLFLLLGALVPLVVLLAPVSQTRYVFQSLPFWIILGIIAVRQIYISVSGHGRILAVGVLVLLLVDPIGQVWLYYNYQNGHRWDWKGAFALVQGKRVDGDLVVTTWPQLGSYYLGDEVIPMHRTQPDDVVQAGSRVWFVDDGWVNPELAKWLLKNTELVDVFDVHMTGKVFPMRVYLYDPNRTGAKDLVNITRD